MRRSVTSDQLTVRAIAGSHVVLLGIHLPQALCANLLGFAVHRTDHEEEEAYWLRGKKTFLLTDPGFPPGATYSTRQHPIQGFTWSDFTAKPNQRYTYRVVALTGAPDALVADREAAVEVTTESELGQTHHVFFNRGASASQEYAHRYGTPPDENNPADPRWAWLSRGVMEEIETFLARAIDVTWGIRVAAYEFRLPRLAALLAAAQARGAHVQVLFDANNNPPDAQGVVFPRDENRATAAAAGISALCLERLTRTDVVSPPIAHHKFIVLTHNGQAEAVLTGSTNFSLGGVFGQANVVHVVNDPQVADSYLQLWTTIAANPPHGPLRQQLQAQNPIPPATPVPRLPAPGTTTIFSPQQNLEALQWYADLAATASDALFMTFAFGMPAIFKEAYRSGQARLRYALLDKLIPSGTPTANRPAAIQEMTNLRFMKENRFAVGSRIAVNRFDRWVKERLTGLNSHVQYVHTKFMLVNPLGADPIVVTGSANFSEASTKVNDENMLVIRGHERVADIYLGEYMRLWNHYAFREWASSQPADPADTAFRHLENGSSWTAEYFGDTDRSRQRAYFSGVP
ncbi:MAG: phospholipase D-like domain-containing protein [Vicinamibacterales bacterium]